MKNRQLPADFLRRMKDLLGTETESYYNSFDEERFYGLRVNTSKLSAAEFQRLSPFPVTRIDWIPNGYYFCGEEKPAKDPYYYAGLYYLQEPSAMTPAFLLPVNPGDMVLDLCAAPGGKSTELGAKLKGKGLLVSNDISNSRARALLKNLELLGIPNICVTSEAPKRLLEEFPEFFDKILVDAPCSGEGMFRKDPDMIKSWEDRGPSYYAGIQKEIMEAACSMLKPGGSLLYSTCTFSPEEDEEIISWVLNTRQDMELVSLPLFPGAARGAVTAACPELTDCVIRLYPHRIKGEGHFIALLQKKGTVQSLRQTEEEPLTKNMLTLLEKSGFFLFAKQLTPELVTSRLMVKNEAVYYLPEGFKRNSRLRYLRTGLLLGELKNGRFEPGQPLAMALSSHEFSTCISFAREDERVIRYLKGETVSLTLQEMEAQADLFSDYPWRLVCVDGFPLGFAKQMKDRLKNKYYPGWRWQ